MAETQSPEVDLIEELSLRRWARENYVAEELRNASWHSVVLDEMREKATELERLGADLPPIRGRVVMRPSFFGSRRRLAAAIFSATK